MVILPVDDLLLLKLSITPRLAFCSGVSFFFMHLISNNSKIVNPPHGVGPDEVQPDTPWGYIKRGLIGPHMGSAKRGECTPIKPAKGSFTAEGEGGGAEFRHTDQGGGQGLGVGRGQRHLWGQNYCLSHASQHWRCYSYRIPCIFPTLILFSSFLWLWSKSA